MAAAGAGAPAGTACAGAVDLRRTVRVCEERWAEKGEEESWQSAHSLARDRTASFVAEMQSEIQEMHLAPPEI